MYSFPNLEPVHCSMFSSNCCFLTCIQVSSCLPLAYTSAMFQPSGNWSDTWLSWCIVCLCSCFACVCVCVCVCMFFFSSFSFTEVCHAKSFQSCPTLCNRMRCNPLGFSVCGILQARILKWVAIPSSRIFLTQGWNLHLLSLLHWQGYWDIIGI